MIRKIPQSQTTDNPVAQRGRAAQKNILIIHFEFCLPDICRHPFEEKLNFVRCVFIVEKNRNSVRNAFSNVSKHRRL